MQRKAMVSLIGVVDPTSENILSFDLDFHVLRLPPQLAFQIQVILSEKTIFWTIIDEGGLHLYHVDQFLEIHWIPNTNQVS